MSGFDPTIDEVLDRVWKGSRELDRARGFRMMDIEDMRIVVSNEIWAKMLIAARDLKSRYYGAIQYGFDGTPGEDGLQAPRAKMFGVVTEISKDLEPHEVRFRAEVSV